MPLMMTIDADPAFKPESAADKAAFKAIKERGAVKVAAVTAYEALRNSRGMYRIKPEAEAPRASIPERQLSDIPTNELKIMYFSMGGKTPTGKQITRDAMIQAIQKQMDAMEVVDDVEADDDPE